MTKVNTKVEWMNDVMNETEWLLNEWDEWVKGKKLY